MFTSSNRIVLVAAAFWIASQAPALASFKFGLGNAAAAEGAKVINKANSEYMSSDGTLVPRLPSCGNNMALFTSPPVTDPAWVAIAPLGHVIAPGHIFPSDHNYWGFNASFTAQLGINMYSPGDGWIMQVTAYYDNINAQPAFYNLTFSPCAEVTMMNISVDTLAPALLHPSGPSSTSCSSNNGNNPGVVWSCVTNMEAPVKGGDFLGTGGLVDFGPIIDTRFEISGFANPSRHNLNRGFCILDYFSPSLKAQYYAMLGGNNGATLIPRTIQPLCGTVMQDIPGTAQGDWYNPNQPNIPEDPHLALIHHNVAFSTGTFSVGTSMPNFTGDHDFNPKTTADGTRINYDFNLVNDNQIYCYDTFLQDFNNGPGGVDSQMMGNIVLLQLTDSQLDTLKIEMQSPGTNCATVGSGNWAFTSNAVTFER